MKEFKFVTKDIFIDINPIKKIIIDKWQSGEFYRFHYKQGDRGECLYESILAEIANYADDIVDEITKNANLASDECLDWTAYQKSNKCSIIFEVLRILNQAWSIPIERLATDDIPTILEFLDTPPGKELEAWDKWEKYWASRDYVERRKRLLENAEK